MTITINDSFGKRGKQTLSFSHTHTHTHTSGGKDNSFEGLLLFGFFFAAVDIFINLSF